MDSNRYSYRCARRVALNCAVLLNNLRSKRGRVMANALYVPTRKLKTGILKSVLLKGAS